MRTLFTTIDVTTTATPSLSSSSTVLAPEHSPLHSPVPYLFGGLAAMLCLIALALVILAFSYWKISGFLGTNNQTCEEVKPSEENESIKVYEEKFVVIMAGDEIPTFLATPISIKGSIFDEEDEETHPPPSTSPTDTICTPPPPPTATICIPTAATESTTTDEMVHHQTENRETQEENRETQEENHDQHQTH